MFKIQVNSFDNVLVEGNPFTGSPAELTDMIKKFVLNYGADPNSSDSPGEAIVSYKTDRGTSHKKFIEILDAVQSAYYQIYADNAGVSVRKWLELSSDLSDPQNRELYDLGRKKRPDGTVEIPMALSIAEPTKAGGK